MQAETFIKTLHQAMPSRDSLLGYGLDEEDIQHIQATFIARKRTTSGDPSMPEVLRLVNDFDCGTVEIGLLQLFSQAKEHPSGMHFANCEADPVVLTPSGTIVMLDHAAQEHQQPCAADSEKFLEALACFLEIRADRPAWVGRDAEAIAACASTAGGKEYTDFYRILCGFLAS